MEFELWWLLPIIAVVFALVLLSESLHSLEIAGGVLIFAGIAFERISRRPLATDAMPAGRDAAEADIREAVGRE